MALSRMQKHSFLRDSEGSIASYNYSELAEGTGIIKFYVLQKATNAGTTYGLTTSSAIYSDAYYSTYTANSAVYANKFEFDAYATFNFTHNMRGLAYANIPIDITPDAGGSASSAYAYVVVTLSKVSGGVTTQVATATSSTKNSTTFTQGGNTIIFCVPLDISTMTTFKSGDQVKLNVQYWAKDTESAAYLTVGYDPAGRTYAYLPTSQTTISLPFVIDR